jgi:hypothetical protein
LLCAGIDSTKGSCKGRTGSAPDGVDPAAPSRETYTSAFCGTMVAKGRSSVIQAAHSSPCGSRVSLGCFSIEPPLCINGRGVDHDDPSKSER